MSYSIGVIGGSGLYSMAGLEVFEERVVETPFGAPSDAFVLGELSGRRIAFLARHGRGHRWLPSELNFRANIWAMKKLGVRRILSLSAVGSMKEQYKPTDVLVPDQFIDRTRHRVDTFFGEGLVAHVAFADPLCPVLRSHLAAAGRAAGASLHEGGTYVCIEGPQFSTRAESLLYRSWGVDVVGMTNLQEAKLAREAEICYATLALITDYDCWHHSEESVTVTAVLAALEANAELAQRLVALAVERLEPDQPQSCGCANALQSALTTNRDVVPAELISRLEPIVGRYYK